MTILDKLESSDPGWACTDALYPVFRLVMDDEKKLIVLQAYAMFMKRLSVV